MIVGPSVAVCGPGSRRVGVTVYGAGVEPAPSITYAGSPFSWTQGTSIGNNDPTNVGGTITSYAVQSGTLPTGVSLDTSTGRISGTPTTAGTSPVTIRATGPGGTDDAEITFTVASSLLTSLIAYWKLDEASGTREDSHTNDLDLTDNNTVTQATGKVDNAGQFTAANTEYLSHTDDALLRTGDIDFTFAGWVYFDSLVAARGILSKARPQNAGGEYEVFFNTGSSAISWWVRKADNSALVTLDSSGTVFSTATWYWVEVYHDAASNVIGIRINNGTAAETAITGGVFSGTNAFHLGALNGAFTMSGRLDEWGFWKRRLTSDERAALYNSGNGKTYPFSL